MYALLQQVNFDCVYQLLEGITADNLLHGVASLIHYIDTAQSVTFSAFIRYLLQVENKQTGELLFYSSSLLLSCWVFIDFLLEYWLKWKNVDLVHHFNISEVLELPHLCSREGNTQKVTYKPR